MAAARALAGRPEVVIADEPTSNLDAEAAAALLAVLRELYAAGGTLVLASHDPRTTGPATRVIELKAGKLV